ncbi:RES family NAD+ phosphorylase [Rhizobium johnstonii]|uniref:RES family NAD+ phosphorylase n=1 Tax=Rhizobium johnstonii TaxID=3019933 RepID=UPI003F9ABBB2
MRFPEVAVNGIYRRLIPSKFPTIDVYERLGPQAVRDEAVRLEELTNPRLISKARILAASEGMSPPASVQLQNWNHAPFTYPNIEGSYLLPSPFPVLELASDIKGALARAILRREAFLSRTADPPQGLDMRVISNSVVGTFVDLRATPDKLDHQAIWSIGKDLYNGGAMGALFTIPEILGSQFAAIFSKACLVESAVQAAHYRFQWDGNSISKIYDFADGKDLTRGQILSSNSFDLASTDVKTSEI